MRHDLVKQQWLSLEQVSNKQLHSLGFTFTLYLLKSGCTGGEGRRAKQSINPQKEPTETQPHIPNLGIQNQHLEGFRKEQLDFTYPLTCWQVWARTPN
jgi:hypothetical protein